MADTSVMDNEREQVIRELIRHCGDGRLTLDELEERIEEAHAAHDEAALRHVLRELPVRPPVATPEAKLPPTVLDPTPVTFPPRSTNHPHPSRRNERGSLEHTLKTVWTIAGFIAIFNGLWWLALILWFVVPKLVLPQIRRT